MDQETREMFGKVLGILEILKTDVSDLKIDVADLKTDVAVLKTDVAVLKIDVANLKTDIADLKQDMDGMKQDMNLMRSRQDEMYLMLKGSEESRQRMKSLEEKSAISAIDRENLKVESAKIVGALRRGAHEILNGLSGEEVS